VVEAVTVATPLTNGKPLSGSGVVVVQAVGVGEQVADSLKLPEELSPSFVCSVTETKITGSAGSKGRRSSTLQLTVPWTVTVP